MRIGRWRVYVPFVRSFVSGLGRSPGSSAPCPRLRGREAFEPGVATNRTHTHRWRPLRPDHMRRATLTSWPNLDPSPPFRAPSVCSTATAQATFDLGRRDSAFASWPSLWRTGSMGIPDDLTKTWRAHHGGAVPAFVAACPPCQGMSMARSERGTEDDPDAGSRDDRNLLVLLISHITKALEPTFVVVENVTGLLRRKVRDPEPSEGISTVRLPVHFLAGDYDVYPFLTDLADYGVPQRRKRAFLTFVWRASSAADLLSHTVIRSALAMRPPSLVDLLDVQHR